MKKLLILSFLTLLVSFAYIGIRVYNASQFGAPPYIDAPGINLPEFLDDYPGLINWKRPEGPLKVGLQAGHWKNSELPQELERIRRSGGGTASSNGVSEWQVNLRIAEETKKILEKEGIVVDILPSTIPPGYWADVFVSIHADGSLDPGKSGYKFATPRRDFTGKAEELLKVMEEGYARETGLRKDPNVTRNMRGYYAFAWWRFDHAIHPMTPAVIAETGFLTNSSDAEILIEEPQVPAKALSQSIIKFLKG